MVVRESRVGTGLDGKMTLKEVAIELIPFYGNTVSMRRHDSNLPNLYGNIHNDYV